MSVRQRLFDFLPLGRGEDGLESLRLFREVPRPLKHSDQAAEVNVLRKDLLFVGSGGLAAFCLNLLQGFKSIEVVFEFAFFAALAECVGGFIGDAEIALVAEFGGGCVRLFRLFRGGSF
jgi:hypothetical protein